jgi:hypothetical protein
MPDFHCTDNLANACGWFSPADQKNASYIQSNNE